MCTYRLLLLEFFFLEFLPTTAFEGLLQREPTKTKYCWRNLFSTRRMLKCSCCVWLTHQSIYCWQLFVKISDLCYRSEKKTETAKMHWHHQKTSKPNKLDLLSFCLSQLFSLLSYLLLLLLQFSCVWWLSCGPVLLQTKGKEKKRKEHCPHVRKNKQAKKRQQSICTTEVWGGGACTCKTLRLSKLEFLVIIFYSIDLAVRADGQVRVTWR